MEFSTIIYEKKNNYAVITLNRPDKLNVINKQMFIDLNDCLDNIKHDNELRCLIITGKGDKAFSAGADINAIHNLDFQSGKIFSQYGSTVFSKLANLNILTVAAINGYALGGGCELALACNIRFASDDAKLGLPEINLGLIPGYGGTQRLAAIVGKPKAMELILTGNVIDAAEAKQIGIINTYYDRAHFQQKVEEFVEQIISKSRPAVSAAIDCINSACKMSQKEALSFESKKFAELCETDAFKEYTSAFIEKRNSKI